MDHGALPVDGILHPPVHEDLPLRDLIRIVLRVVTFDELVGSLALPAALILPIDEVDFISRGLNQLGIEAGDVKLLCLRLLFAGL